MSSSLIHDWTDRAGPVSPCGSSNSCYELWLSYLSVTSKGLDSSAPSYLPVLTFLPSSSFQCFLSFRARGINDTFRAEASTITYSQPCILALTTVGLKVAFVYGYKDSYLEGILMPYLPRYVFKVSLMRLWKSPRPMLQEWAHHWHCLE